MKKKMNNKGFSLVELIVVIAIMAILAVTLAPRLTQYVEKARKGADKEVINTIYTAVQYALLDEDIKNAAFNYDSGTDGIDLAALATANGLSLNSLAAVDVASEIYEVSGGVWKTNTDNVNDYTFKDNKFIKEIYEVVGDFKLKSDDAKETTNIVIYATNAEDIEVKLFYTYIPTGTNIADYTVSSSDVR